MPNHETKRIGPGMAREVYPKVKEAVLDGWQVYGMAGPVRVGCDHDTVEVYLVRAKEPEPGKCLLPDNDLDGGREA